MPMSVQLGLPPSELGFPGLPIDTQDDLLDGFIDALGKAVADERRRWSVEVERISAESRVLIAELRTRNLELERELRAIAEDQQRRIEVAIAGIRDGKDGAPGEPGAPGKDVDPDAVALLIDTKLLAAVEALPRAKDGRDGKDAEPLDLDFVRRTLAEQVAALKLPRGEKGDPGQPGRDAEPLDLDFVRRAIDDRIALLELPRGEKGDPGEPGRDADPAVIEALVDDRVAKTIAELPQPVDGKDGAPGKDAEPELIRSMIDEQLALRPLPEKGDPGEPGRDADPLDLDFVRSQIAEQVAAIPKAQDGAPGRDADPEVTRAMIAEQIAALPPAPAGPPGEPGVSGKDADPAVIEAVVRKFVDEIPRPKDGEPGPPGKDADPKATEAMVRALVAELPPAERGEPGPPGPAGKDGVGMAGAMLNRDGELVITCTDGSMRELGLIVGKDGRDGRDGEPGAPGRDGLGFEDFEVEDFDERSIKLRWVRGDHAVERIKTFPAMIYRGVHKAGTAYDAGDAVTFGGSIWVAMEPTSEKPGEGVTAWKLACKKGRDGRDGEVGAKGAPGPAGPPGRDWTAKGPST
jgi:hypothetical protein